jgi:uncharacterized OB-fold protein
MSELKRPQPILGIYEKPFWDALNQKQFKLQCCSNCKHIWYPPGPVCPECLSDDWKMTLMSGNGKVIAWTTFHRQYFPELPTPYLVVSVELNEGPLMIGNLFNPQDFKLELNLPVKAIFERVESSLEPWNILQWEPDTSVS